MRPTCLSVQLSILLCLCLFTACKKNDSGSSGTVGGSFYMRFKANGVQKEYLQNTAGSFNKQQTTNTANYAATFTGTIDPFNVTKDNMTVVLVTAGQNMQNLNYTNFKTTVAGTSKAYILQPGYYDEAGGFYTSWSDDFLSALPAGIETNAKLTVTSASSTSIKGIFSAILYSSDYAKKITITEGDFNIKAQ